MKQPIPEADPKHPDMSPEAIDQRLRQLDQVYKLGMSLRNVKLLGPVNNAGSWMGDAPAESS